MVYLFLDTNVFLHFRYYTEVPWDTIINSKNVTVVIPPIVLEELDKKKADQNRKTAQRAKTVISKLYAISEGKAPPVPTKIISKRPSASTFAQYGLSERHADDHIFASYLEFEIEPTDAKIVITNDATITLRSDSFGVKSIRIPSEYQLPSELDSVEKELEETKQQLDKIKNRLPKVTIGFGDSILDHLIITPVPSSDKSDFIESEWNKIKEEFPPMKKEEKEKGAFSGFSFHEVSDSQIEEYNFELLKFYSQSRNYLEEESNYQEYLSRCLEIKLIASNTGTAPAEDIDVALHFPDGFELVEELKPPPKEPIPPYKPTSILEAPSFNFDSIFGKINKIEKLKNLPNNGGPVLTRIEKTNSYDVEFSLGNLKHNQISQLPTLYACFDSFEDMKSFQIEYWLMIGNLPEQIEGELNVKIENREDS